MGMQGISGGFGGYTGGHKHTEFMSKGTKGRWMEVCLPL